MQSQEGRLLRPDEAARVLGIGLKRMLALVATGEVPVIVLGPRVRRIPLDALQDWMRARVSDKAKSA